VRRLVAAVWIVGGGCGFHPSLTPADDDAAVHPDGISIDAAPDVAIDAADPNGDSDGDGVANGVDNCPTIANSDQHNEDGDAPGDACDGCPQVPGSNLDTDTDGVPDACDPHPMTAGDHLLSFEPFKQAGGLPAGWQVVAGMTGHWSVTGDALRGDLGTSTEIVLRETNQTNHAIDIGFTVAHGVSGVQEYVTALTDARAQFDQFDGCGIRFDPPAYRELFGFNNPNFDVLDTDTTEPPTAGGYRYFHVHEATVQSCAIPTANAVHRLMGNYATQDNTMVGIRARNVTLMVRYVAIYTF
jgi:hypothetical protein